MRSFASLAMLGMFVACTDADAPSGPVTLAGSPPSPSASTAIDAAKGAPPSPKSPRVDRYVLTHQVSNPLVNVPYTTSHECPDGKVAVSGTVYFQKMSEPFTDVVIVAFGLTGTNGFTATYKATAAQSFYAFVGVNCLTLG